VNTATITYKSQITIPKEVREALGLKAGDRVFFVVEGDKALMFPIRVRGLEHLRGVGRGRAPFPGWEAEREEAKQAVVQHALGLHSDRANAEN
jgi:antitoxin PrlF